MVHVRWDQLVIAVLLVSVVLAVVSAGFIVKDNHVHWKILLL